MIRIPSNNDPYYPPEFHEEDCTPDLCECEEPEIDGLICTVCGFVDGAAEYCGVCGRPAIYCGCP